MPIPGIVWVVTSIESSARDYGPIQKIFAHQRHAEDYAASLMAKRSEGCEDIIYDCSAFTLYTMPDSVP